MYKLVILDLDGTLLNSEKKISDFTCDIIGKIRNQAKIVLASARGFGAIKPYLEQLDLLDDSDYTIAFNGSLVLSNLERKIVDNKISIESLNLLNQYVEENLNCDWYLYTYHKKYRRSEIDNVDKFLQENQIYKVVGISDENTTKKLRLEIPSKIEELFQISSSEKDWIEFVTKGMTKVVAIKILLNKLGIDRKDVIAIGDGENDIEMIKYVGCGIAMQNATNEVKSCAKIITESNDNDGVGKILEKLFLKT